MKNIAYYNGIMGGIEDVSVPMTDRVCYFGDGVYDAVYSINHKMIEPAEHIDRFFISMSLADINPPCTKGELNNLLLDMLPQVEGKHHFIYFQATRGCGVRDHNYDSTAKSNLWIFIKQGELQPLDKPIKCITTIDNRHCMCNIKTCNLLPNILALKKAKDVGADEAIFIYNNFVTECTHSNVHIIKDGKVITAPTDNKILAGVQRHHLLMACEALGVVVEERHYTLQELYQADEAFITSAGALCVRINEIDGKKIGKKDEHTYGILLHHLKAEVDRATATPAEN